MVNVCSSASMAGCSAGPPPVFAQAVNPHNRQKASARASKREQRMLTPPVIFCKPFLTAPIRGAACINALFLFICILFY